MVCFPERRASIEHTALELSPSNSLVGSSSSRIGIGDTEIGHENPHIGEHRSADDKEQSTDGQQNDEISRHQQNRGDSRQGLSEQHGENGFMNVLGGID